MSPGEKIPVNTVTYWRKSLVEGNRKGNRLLIARVINFKLIQMFFLSLLHYLHKI